MGGLARPLFLQCKRLFEGANHRLELWQKHLYGLPLRVDPIIASVEALN